MELPVMNSPEPAVRPAPNSSPARRIAAAVILSGLVFAVLWIMVFSMITSLLIGAGCCVVIVAASSLSDLVDALLDAIASVIFGVLAVIAAIFAAILRSVRILALASTPYLRHPEVLAERASKDARPGSWPSPFETAALRPPQGDGSRRFLGHWSDSNVKQRGVRPRSRG